MIVGVTWQSREMQGIVVSLEYLPVTRQETGDRRGPVQAELGPRQRLT